MGATIAGTQAKPSALVTVAFLKAQLDEGSDHLGIFMPLLLDCIHRAFRGSFATADVQQSLADHYSLAMPHSAVETLLKRATRKGHLTRGEGRYRVSTVGSQLPDVLQGMAQVRDGQCKLGESLRQFAAERSLPLQTTEDALDLLLRFLEDEQVALLLGRVSAARRETTSRERAVIAEFIGSVVASAGLHASVLRDILEGLVLYNAAFLPNLGSQTRKFQGLQAAFDSVLVRQALGYEGTAAQTLMRNAIDLMKAGGLSCLVFDKTVHEIGRILAMYERKLATEDGIRSLRQVAMARHFLTQNYKPSDVRQMRALLETDIRAAGFHIRSTPARVSEFVAAEQALARRLADPHTKDELEPRVQHDVDCVAAILTMRAGHYAGTIDDCKAVFVSTSQLVIKNTRLWYEEDEHGSGIEPIVHLRALSNLAWLKAPLLCTTMKQTELVALCAAALRPRQETWDKFLNHLKGLEQSGRLTSNEVTAVLVSAMSDRLLREAEDDDGPDVDANTLDEIVERVKASYAAKSEHELNEAKQHYEETIGGLEKDKQVLAKELADANAAKVRLTQTEERLDALESEAERGRRVTLHVEGRARWWARFLSRAALSVAALVLLVGAGALFFSHPLKEGVLAKIVGIAVGLFIVLELVGVLRHVRDWSVSLEARLTTKLRARWSGSSC